MQPNSDDMTEFYHEHQTSAQNQMQQTDQVQPVMMAPGGQIIVQQAGGGGGGAVAAIVVIVVVVVVAVTIVVAGVLYVWASSLAGDSTGGSLDTYTWADYDAANADGMSDAGGDALVEISMTSGGALNWAVVKVTIKVDGGTPQACAEDDSTAACSYSAYQGGDNSKAWEAYEGITISEGDDNDLCDGYYGGCNVEVTITKVGVGNEGDKVIGTVNAYADANA